jgi:hypothetical protein
MRRGAGGHAKGYQPCSTTVPLDGYAQALHLESMRTILAALAFVGTAQGAIAQSGVPVETTLNTLAIVMVAETYCKLPVDHAKLEDALNFNGIYSGDITRDGRFYSRVRYHYGSLINILQTTPGASCEALRTNLNAGASVWRGVIQSGR